MTFWDIIKILIVICIAAALVYLLFVRPWILRMGTLRMEREMSLAGDDLVVSPNMKYMQAITINAPRDIVWSYLIQVGYRRGGWYNWDFINRLSAKDYFFENNKSAERIIPELQNLKEGDKIYLAPPIGLDVFQLKDKEYFILTGYEKGQYICKWLFMVKPIDDKTTRLYVRWASKLGEGLLIRLMNFLIVEPGGAGIQQRQMFRGIKRRAEAEFSKRIDQ